jgi:hypothetical protein
MALAIFAAQRFELAAIVTHVRSSSALLPAWPVATPAFIRLDRRPLSARISRLLKAVPGKSVGQRL